MTKSSSYALTNMRCAVETLIALRNHVTKHDEETWKDYIEAKMRVTKKNKTKFYNSEVYLVDWLMTV